MCGVLSNRGGIVGGGGKIQFFQNLVHHSTNISLLQSTS
jgi:hypothetical protein